MRLLKPVLVLVVVIGIALGGCNTQDYDDETIEKAKEVTESYLKNNYQDIETVEFEEVKESPMGGMMLTGEVNGEAGFTVGMDADTFDVGSVGRKKGFPDRKEECKEQACE